MLLFYTNVCISLIRSRPHQVRERFERALSGGQVMSVSTITIFELWYGVPKSAKPATNKARVETFLVGPFTILDFDADDAGVAGLLRAKLEKQGQPIGAYDLLIAAQGVRHGMTVVTNNLKEFKRVPGLSLEDWTL